MVLAELSELFLLDAECAFSKLRCFPSAELERGAKVRLELSTQSCGVFDGNNGDRWDEITMRKCGGYATDLFYELQT